MEFQDLYFLISKKIFDYYNEKEKFVNLCKTFFKDDKKWLDILAKHNSGQFSCDPLTLLCIINGDKEKNRINKLNNLCSLLNIEERFDDHETFKGVSILNNNHRVLFCDNESISSNVSSNICWDIFVKAIKFSENSNDLKLLNELAKLFNSLNSSILRSWDRLTHALSYVNPNFYIALSRPNRYILSNTKFIEEHVYKEIKNINLFQIDGYDYFKLCISLSKLKITNILALSDLAYTLKSTSEELIDKDYFNDLDNEVSDKLLEKYKNEKPESIFTSKGNIKSTLRSKHQKIVALHFAHHKCEYDESHLSFDIDDQGTQYVEVHHIIPISKIFGDFTNKGLDHYENMVCLCPNCHRKIHYGNIKERREMLNKILNDDRLNLLKQIDIDFEKEVLIKKILKKEKKL